MKTIQSKKITLTLAICVLASSFSVLAAPGEAELRQKLFATGGDTYEYSMRKGSHVAEAAERFFVTIDELVVAAKKSEAFAKSSMGKKLSEATYPDNPLRHLDAWLGTKEIGISGYRTFAHPVQKDRFRTQMALLANVEKAEGLMWTLLQGKNRAKEALGMLPANSSVVLYVNLNTSAVSTAIDTLLKEYGSSTKQIQELIAAESGEELDPTVMKVVNSLTGEVAIGFAGKSPEDGTITLLIGVTAGTKLSEFSKQISGAGYEASKAGKAANSTWEMKGADGKTHYLTQQGTWVVVTTDLASLDGAGKRPLPKPLAALAGQISDQTWLAAGASPETGDLLVNAMEDEGVLGPDGDLNPFIDWKSVFTVSAVGNARPNSIELTVDHSIPLDFSQAQYMPAAVAIGGIGAAIAIPAATKARETAYDNLVLNNLRLIESAKDQFAIEEGLTTGTKVTAEQIAPYIR